MNKQASRERPRSTDWNPVLRYDAFVLLVLLIESADDVASSILCNEEITANQNQITSTDEVLKPLSEQSEELRITRERLYKVGRSA